MRLLVYILTIGILLISPQLKGQDINSYNVNAILDIDNKSIEIKQIMKFIVTEEPCLKSGGGCDNDTAKIYSVASRGPNSSTLSIASPQPRTTHVSGSSAR